MQIINSYTKVINFYKKQESQSKKGEGKSLISKKESAGKYSDFCLRFCKKQPVKYFIPALKRKKRRAAKSEHFTPKTKPIPPLNSA